MRIIFLISFLVASVLATAQDIAKDKITWKVNQGDDTAAKKNFTYNCIFKMDGQGKIIWQQKNGTYNTEFNIVSVEGSWTDVTKSGQVTYNLVDEVAEARMVFEKSGSGTAITLLILPEGTKYIFRVYDVVIEK